MKKLLLTLIVSFLIGFPVFGNNTVDLTGSIAPFIQVTVAETTLELFAIDDSGFDEQQTRTGSVNITERSNRFAGYTVTVTSDNTWNLVNENYNSEVHDTSFLLPYTFTYDGAAPTGYGDAAIEITNSNNRTPGTGIVKAFEVSVNIPVGSPEGDYTDTLTFTIAAK